MTLKQICEEKENSENKTTNLILYHGQLAWYMPFGSNLYLMCFAVMSCFYNVELLNPEHLIHFDSVNFIVVIYEK